MTTRTAALVAALSLAGCQAIPSSSPPPPPPASPPVVVKAPSPPPPPRPVPVEPELAWDVAPLTPGNWRYEKAGADSLARFGEGTDRLVLRCERASRQLVLRIGGTVAKPNAAVTIRTSAGVLAWAGGAAVLDSSSILVTRPATDPGFDWIAFSRGRISIEVAGQPRIIAPVWADISRVIEDCRG